MKKCIYHGIENCSRCYPHQKVDNNLTPDFTPKERLEYLRGEIKAERISYSEIAELQGLAKYIDKDDVLLLEWAGVPEFEEDAESTCNSFEDWKTCPRCLQLESKKAKSEQWQGLQHFYKMKSVLLPAFITRNKQSLNSIEGALMKEYQEGEKS